MHDVIKYLKEQIVNLPIIFRIAKYTDKDNYQSYYLGLAWRILNPAIQVAIYYLIFGVLMRRSSGDIKVPYLPWMLIGMTVWFYSSSVIMGAAQSISSQINMVSKMNFPISIMPSIQLVVQFTTFGVMGIISILLVLKNHFPVTVYWLQIIYYFFAMIMFLLACGILNATMTTLIRDYRMALQSLMRVLMFLSGTMFDISRMPNIPKFIRETILFNPFYYIIEGFRDALFSRTWFWDKGTYTLFFWCFTMLILIVGSHMHMKFRNQFADFV